MIAAEAQVGGLVEQLERRQTGGHRERVAGQRARLVDLAGGREHAHQLGASADGSRRQAAADDLAHDRQVAADAEQLLRAAARDAKAADHLVEHEQRAGGVRALAQQREEPPSAATRRRTSPMLAGSGSAMIAASS